MSAYEGKQPPRWTTSWPEWYGIEGNTQVVPASDYDALADRVEAVERDAASKQARIDALMLEYCPDEMTPDQREEWARHQKPAIKE